MESASRAPFLLFPFILAQSALRWRLQANTWLMTFRRR